MEKNKIRLLAAGIRFPPETFILLKLRSLAKKDCKVTAYTSAGQLIESNLTIKSQKTWYSLSNLERLYYIPYLIIVAFIKHPLKLLRLIKVVFKYSDDFIVFIKLLVRLCPLISENPSIIHFE